ncbi:MAG: hypothetical protein WC648_04680 [Candidatus Paceibacterota bacterium]|jgi:hypothetical protein
MKHTQGEWVALEAGVNLPDTEGGHEVHTSVDGQLVWIAECCEGHFSEHYPDTWEGVRSPDYHLTNDEALANARRIVACVNACESISTELLESKSQTPRNAFKQIADQRDKLLSALKIIECGELPDGDSVNISTQLFADEIIKEVEGTL